MKTRTVALCVSVRIGLAQVPVWMYYIKIPVLPFLVNSRAGMRHVSCVQTPRNNFLTAVAPEERTQNNVR